MYVQYDANLASNLRGAGFKYLVEGKQLPAEVVAFEGTFSHFELIPGIEIPADLDYNPIDSPEGAMMAGGIDDVFYWIHQKYLTDVLR
jgi:hypothetical protein